MTMEVSVIYMGGFDGQDVSHVFFSGRLNCNHILIALTPLAPEFFESFLAPVCLYPIDHKTGPAQSKSGDLRISMHCRTSKCLAGCNPTPQLNANTTIPS